VAGEGSVKCWILRIESCFLTIDLQCCRVALRLPGLRCVSFVYSAYGGPCRPGKRSAAGQSQLSLFLIVLVIHPGINKQRHNQNAEHHAQRNGDRNVIEIDDQHLDTDKHQNYRQAVFEH